MARVLVTGGAGFIGRYVCDLLVRDGYEVVVLDSLEPVVHGDKPPDLPKILLVAGRVEDLEAVKSVLPRSWSI